MPHFCGVVNCGNRSERDNKSYFRVPTIVKTNCVEKVELSKRRRERWIQALKRDDLNETKIKNMRICSDHFLSGAPSALEDVNNPDWIPNTKMGYSSTLVNPAATSLHRAQRARKRKKLQQEDASSFQEAEDFCDLSDSVAENEFNEGGVEIQTELTMLDLNQLAEVNRNLTAEIHKLKATVHKLTISQETFENDPDRTLYYTGIPSFAALMIIFDLISPYLTETDRFPLSKFQQLILTLMRLRLGLSFTDLSYRFKVSRSTVSRVFTDCLYILYQCLKKFIKWPERESLRATMPQSFSSSFGDRITVILDCFEVFIEKPSNLLASAQSWSNYKHHHTVKFLLGIAPQGVITFISKAWGGRVSDKYITENSGVLDNLLPGDIVLADRGFTIADAVSLYCAEVKTPAFTKGRKQLSSYDIEQTRNIAHVRIHVERVIGTLRQKYKILKNTVPISVLVNRTSDRPATVDQIVTVCCALVNICPSVVPRD